MAEDRCDYTDPGIPSVNHPDKPIAPPWQCVRDAGHDGSHRAVAVCDLTVPVNGRPWPCVRALQHDGLCKVADEAAWLPKPLRECDREELVQSAAMAFGVAAQARRDAAATNARLLRDEAMLEAVAVFLLGTKSPHGNNHTADCWQRSAHCFAQALVGGRRLEEMYATSRDAIRARAGAVA